MFQWPDSDDTGSVGNIFLPGTDIMLVDDDGKDITAYDTRGEVCVRGNTIIKGYYKNQKATEESWDSEGFFHTGDILYCDGKSKKWYCVDRKKGKSHPTSVLFTDKANQFPELIKVRGFQVAPPELEGLLLAHPDIADAAVIGVPEAGEEKPRAFVVRQPGSKVTEDEVKNVISSQLASYKRLTGGVTFVDEIPKSPNGKILKRILRDRVAAENKAKSKL
jgi:acyl-CoA synthetase (AMP-forming)/AMP-acid ligase II